MSSSGISQNRLCDLLDPTKDSLIVDIVKELDINIDSLDLKDIPILSAFLNDLENLQDLRNFKKELNIRASFSSNNFFKIADTSEFNNEVVLYNEFKIEKSLKIGKIPFLVTGSAMLEDGNFNSRLSNISIQYDADTYLEKLKEEEYKVPTINNLIQNNVFQEEIFSKEEFDNLKTEIKYRIYKMAIEKLQQKCIGSYMNTDSLLSINTMLKIEIQNQIDSLELTKQRLPRNFQNDIIEKLDSIMNYAKNLENSDALIKNLTETENMKALQKIKLWTKNFRIGTFGLGDANNAVKHLSLNGINYEFEKNGFYSRISLGVESYMFDFIPSINSILTNTINGNKLFIGTVGFKDKNEEYLEFGILSGGVNNAISDTLISPIKSKNFVYSLRSSNRLLKNITLENDISYSIFLQNSFPVVEIQNESKSSIRNFAIESKIQLKELDWAKFNFGYFFVGPNFNSLGNPFIFKNRQGLLIEGSVTRLEKKLTLSIDMRLGREVSKFDVEEYRDMNLALYASYTINSNNSVNLVVSPNVFKTRIDASNGISSNTSIFNFQYNSKGNFKSVEIGTNFTFSNFNSNQVFNDTLDLNTLYTVGVNEVISISKNNSIEIGVQIASPELNTDELSDSYLSLGHRIFNEKLRFGYYGQFQKSRFLGGNNYVGVKSDYAIKFNESFQLALYVNFLWPLDAQGGFLTNGNLSLNYFIN